MGKARTILYEPVDKFAGVAWGFIRLVCMEHTEERPELLLRNTHAGPCYQCGKESCSASMPAELYEKLLDLSLIHIWIEHGDADKTIEEFTKAVERFANMG